MTDIVQTANIEASCSNSGIFGIQEKIFIGHPTRVCCRNCKHRTKHPRSQQWLLHRTGFRRYPRDYYSFFRCDAMRQLRTSRWKKGSKVDGERFAIEFSEVTVEKLLGQCIESKRSCETRYSCGSGYTTIRPSAQQTVPE